MNEREELAAMVAKLAEMVGALAVRVEAIERAYGIAIIDRALDKVAPRVKP